MRRLVLPAAFLLACGGSQLRGSGAEGVVSPPPTAPPAASAAPPPAPQDDESRARAVVNQIVAKDWDGLVAAFDERMRAALTKEKLAATWDSVTQTAGAFQRIDSVEVQPKGDLRLAVVKATFEHAPLLLRVAFDAQGKVAGLLITPGDAAGAWQPPPYADSTKFEEKDVTIGTAPALPGTWTTPKGTKAYPAVVLVHGSGPNDRDESIGALKVFKDLAYGLASHGVAVLRYEKRTRVDPAGVRTQKEEVDDAAHAAVAFVASQPDVDKKRIVLVGHSQGGYLGPRIAKSDPTIRGVVLLAGSTRPLEDSLVSQLRYLASAQPADGMADNIADAERFRKDAQRPTLKPDDDVELPTMLGRASIPGAYFLDVRGYHPEKVAAQLPIPLLVLQGERDYQVTVADDFAAWKAALGKKTNATLKTYPALNHAFTAGTGPSLPAEYMKPAHVDEKVIADIADWVTKLAAH